MVKMLFQVSTESVLGVFPDGSLYLRAPLDREASAFHAVDVVATDRGKGRRTATTRVVVYVSIMLQFGIRP